MEEEANGYHPSKLPICTSNFSPIWPSGHYMYRQLNIHNSTFSPHTVFMCFVGIWEQTAIISLYNINWLVCITEMECVYCAVRSGCLYIIQINRFKTLNWSCHGSGNRRWREEGRRGSTKTGPLPIPRCSWQLHPRIGQVMGVLYSGQLPSACLCVAQDTVSASILHNISLQTLDTCEMRANEHTEPPNDVEIGGLNKWQWTDLVVRNDSRYTPNSDFFFPATFHFGSGRRIIPACGRWWICYTTPSVAEVQ